MARTRTAEPQTAQATLHYGDGEYAVLKSGRFVICAVSGKSIPLETLRYWSVSLQEAYAGPDEAFQRLGQVA